MAIKTRECVRAINVSSNSDKIAAVEITREINSLSTYTTFPHLSDLSSENTRKFIHAKVSVSVNLSVSVGKIFYEVKSLADISLACLLIHHLYSVFCHALTS